jgi:hypothetical protein
MKAKANSYASGGVARVLADGCHEFVFEEGGFVYRDRYYGDNPFVGEEVVLQNGKVVWAMNFYGGVTSDSVPEGEVYKFLQRAMRQLRPERPFRGPEVFAEAAYEYCDESQGALDGFVGAERILYQGQEVYHLHYHGGRVISH